MTLKLENKSVRYTPSAVVSNDLHYFLSTLAEINEVVSQTYGPDAGYVAQHDISSGEDIFEYSKDGLTTLNNMVFTDPTDDLVLSMVKQLASRIKERSGDGSTTATKLLFYMVKHAVEKIYDKDPLWVKQIRVNTPKAMELLAKGFEEELTKFTQSTVTLEDLRYAAKVALNSDETLMVPIDLILNHLKETNAPIDESLKMEALRSYSDQTSVMINPGYILGASEFAIDSTCKELDNVKVVLMPCNISYNMLHEIMSKIIENISALDKEIKVIFLVNSIEDDATREAFKAMLRQAQANNIQLRFDFIELSAAFKSTDHRLIDISYLLNTNIVDLLECIEMRDDDPRTKYVYKWVKSENDINYGYNKFMNKLISELSKSFYADIKTMPGLGFTVALSSVALESQRTPEYKTIFDNHIKGLKEASKNQDTSVANDAKARLFYLQDNYHIISIAKRIGDQNRIYTAYKDAVKAMTSVAAHGYYMGGSIGAYMTTLSYKQNKVIDDKYTYAVKESLDFLIDVLSTAIESVIGDLKISFDGLTIKEIIQTRCVPKEYKIDDQIIIVPVETDKVMIPTVLYLFSNIFSSLMVEFRQHVDAARFRFISDQVDKAIKKAASPEPAPDLEPAPEDNITVDEDVDGGYMDELPEEDTEEEIHDDYIENDVDEVVDEYEEEPIGEETEEEEIIDEVEEDKWTPGEIGNVVADEWSEEDELEEDEIIDDLNYEESEPDYWGAEIPQYDDTFIPVGEDADKFEFTDEEREEDDVTPDSEDVLHSDSDYYPAPDINDDIYGGGFEEDSDINEDRSNDTGGDTNEYSVDTPLVIPEGVKVRILETPEELGIHREEEKKRKIELKKQTVINDDDDPDTIRRKLMAQVDSTLGIDVEELEEQEILSNLFSPYDLNSGWRVVDSKDVPEE